MTKYEILSIVIASSGFVLGIISIFTSGKALNTNKKMFKRQGVIDLHMAWNGINEIDVNDLVTPDIVNAVNALTLTAALWNHDVIEKYILYQSYWESYSNLYKTLKNCSKLVPATSKKCNELLSKEITRAYVDMEHVDLSKVMRTTI